MDSGIPKFLGKTIANVGQKEVKADEVSERREAQGVALGAILSEFDGATCAL